MAVIKKDRLTGEASQIADSAIRSQIAMGNQQLIALQQQREILNATQQQLVAQTNTTLGQVKDSIYKAQRTKRAENAMLGFSGDVAQVRGLAEVQDLTANELSNIIDQTEQGAIGIAGQQSAINKAEVQSASDSILDKYADTLIEQGKAKQDTGRMVLNGLTGAVTGAIEGLIGGKLFTSGAKALINPSSGFLKSALGGLGVAGTLAYGSNKIGKLVNVGNENYGDRTQLYNEKTGNDAFTGALVSGALAGAGLGLLNKKLGTSTLTSNLIKEVAGTGSSVNLPAVLNTNGFTATQTSKLFKLREAATGSKLLNASTAAKVVNTAGLKGAAKAKAVFGNVLSKGKGFMKMNPWVAAASAGIGAIIGGVTAGMDKKYALNLDDIRNDDTFKQFQDFGLDLDQLVDIVYNK